MSAETSLVIRTPETLVALCASLLPTLSWGGDYPFCLPRESGRETEAGVDGVGPTSSGGLVDVEKLVDAVLSKVDALIYVGHVNDLCRNSL